MLAGSGAHLTDAGRRFYNAYGPTEATVFATYIGPMTTTEE